jgi:hypothetical protein
MNHEINVPTVHTFLWWYTFIRVRGGNLDLALFWIRVGNSQYTKGIPRLKTIYTNFACRNILIPTYKILVQQPFCFGVFHFEDSVRIHNPLKRKFKASEEPKTKHFVGIIRGPVVVPVFN